MSELAERSGVSIPTIKFYIREGLLPPGRTTSPRQADYDESHLDRLRLVRALVDVGGLSLASVREVLDAVTGPAGLDQAIARAHGGLAPRPPAEPDTTRARALVGRLGWVVDEHGAPLRQLAAALEAAQAVGLDVDDALIDVYAGAAAVVARYDVSIIPWSREDPAPSVTQAVLGTVLYEPLLLALRRLAQSDAFVRGPQRDGGATA
ncbi:MAG: MerR family transcriptional regulator [Kineosporiaceae bacterium]